MFKRGFTLTELLVVIAIIGILGTTLVPVIGSAVDKARVAKAIALVSTLETACDSYYSDTARYAREYGSTAYSSYTYHNLALDDRTADWEGPYIKKPLASGDNPFGGSFVYLYNTLTGGTCSPASFDLNGDGTADRSGAGNFVCFSGVTQTIAEKIDNAYDKGVAGTWSTTGRVKYQGGGYGIVNIYISGGV